MRRRTIARECALKILYRVDITAETAAEAAKGYWEDYPQSSTIQQFADELAEGTYKNLEEIDSAISKYAENWQIKRMAVIDRNIMRMATCELLYMDDIPPKVSINEAIDLAKRYGDTDSGKFVNGILDKVAKHESKKS